MNRLSDETRAKPSKALRRYRAIDLSLWCFLLILFESVIILASTRMFPSQPYTVSLVPAFIAIVMVRWGIFAAFPCVLGGLVFCVLQGASPAQFPIYCLGNLLALAALPLRNRFLKDRGVFEDALHALLFALVICLLAQCGRALVSLCLGTAPALALGFVTTESVTDLFTLVIIWVCRRLDGVLEDQPHYLARLDRESKVS